jgi:hypothetical protein
MRKGLTFITVSTVYTISGQLESIKYQVNTGADKFAFKRGGSHL